jgi:sporulation protein YlmC with PRC-barrel domain
MAGTIKLGATVVTADGHELGTIDKLVLDPDGGDLHAMVIRKGLFSRDVEIPIDDIVGQEAGRVQIRHTNAQLDDLPGFYEASYTTPPPERSAELLSGYGYPASGLLWPSRWSGPVSGEPYGHEAVGQVGDEVAAMHRAQDLTNAVIKEGSEVRSLDGEKVGEVHQITIDAATGQPTSLVIRKGFLFHEDVEIPAGLISSLDDGRVYLDARHDELEQYLKDHAHR